MDVIILIPVLALSFVVHEFAHAWQAAREGDDTPVRDGRVTLNPLKHLDLFGSFLIPAILFQSSGLLFGWARPVLVNASNYRDEFWGDIRVSLAGVVANAITAVVVTLLMAVVAWLGSVTDAQGGFSAVLDLVYVALSYALILNLVLVVFNLIPIPPLDGSHVVARVLPPEWAARYRRLGGYGLLGLIGALYLGRFVGIDLFPVLLWPVTFFRDLADMFVRLWI